MANIGLLFIVLSNIILIYADLPLLPLPTIGISNDLTSFYIPKVGYAGTISFPFETICKTPGADDYLFCYLCNMDCFAIHNLYGGKCGPRPDDPSQYTCLCAKTPEEAAARNITTSSRTTCKDYPLPPLPYEIAAVDQTASLVVLQTRLRGLECPIFLNGTYDTTACSTDCRTNHGLAGGYCGKSVPNVPDFGTAKTLHCECLV